MGIMKKIKLAREKKTVRAMIRIYCRGMDHHRPAGRHCEDCENLLRYAHERLDRCIFGEEKPVCAQCPVHCYRPDRRREIAGVMRYAGPRMLLSHPFLVIRHLMTEKKKQGETVRKYLACKNVSKSRSGLTPENCTA